MRNPHHFVELWHKSSQKYTKLTKKNSLTKIWYKYIVIESTSGTNQSRAGGGANDRAQIIKLMITSFYNIHMPATLGLTSFGTMESDYVIWKSIKRTWSVTNQENNKIITLHEH